MLLPSREGRDEDTDAQRQELSERGETVEADTSRALSVVGSQ